MIALLVTNLRKAFIKNINDGEAMPQQMEVSLAYWQTAASDDGILRVKTKPSLRHGFSVHFLLSYPQHAFKIT
jgi:hypothetical protein